MILPSHKTKIVCTIGPASQLPDIMSGMMVAGMNIARLNFSHGDFAFHKAVIKHLRYAARETKKRITVMADLPGPKMRIGRLAEEPLELNTGDAFTLTSDDIVGNRERVSINLARLPHVVKPGDTLFLNDGVIQLEVTMVQGNDVLCRVVVGGELRSKKGLNMPGIDLGISAFTPDDRTILKFALDSGVDAVSQSFVSDAQDIRAVKEAAASLGYSPFVIAKIERAGALRNIDEIMDEADGIMIARGDLGVEIPIEQIAVVQKGLVEKANRAGKPVITATQMLESMIEHRRPSRAEATDVANAILDGTDCVMLSGESAMGRYPVEAVAMLARIAETTEPHRPRHVSREMVRTYAGGDKVDLVDIISLNVNLTLERITPAAIFVPTVSGATARNIGRFRLPVWLIAISPGDATCRSLQFSYGVFPVHMPEYPEDWNAFIRDWLGSRGIRGRLAILTEGPSTKNPDSNNRMEIIDLERL